jgi:conjugative transfer signal peptidase TraF
LLKKRKKILRPAMRNVLTLLSALVLTCLGVWDAGFRVNVTSSMPPGIYRIAPGLPERGDYVSFCLAGDTAAFALERGYLRPGICPSGTRPLLKRLAGVAGDEAHVAPEGIYVNSVLQPASAALDVDKNGTELPRVNPEGRIPSGQALLLAAHQGSYDSRYFGLVPAESLQRVKAVWLW